MQVGHACLTVQGDRQFVGAGHRSMGGDHEAYQLKCPHSSSPMLSGHPDRQR